MYPFRNSAVDILFPCLMFIMVTGETFSIKVIKGYCSQVDCSREYLLLANFNHTLLVSKVILLDIFTWLERKPHVLNINAAKVGTVFPWILYSCPVLFMIWESNRSVDQNRSSGTWRVSAVFVCVWVIIHQPGLDHDSRSPLEKGLVIIFQMCRDALSKPLKSALYRTGYIICRANAEWKWGVSFSRSMKKYHSRHKNIKLFLFFHRFFSRYFLFAI